MNTKIVGMAFAFALAASNQTNAGDFVDDFVVLKGEAADLVHFFLCGTGYAVSPTEADCWIMSNDIAQGHDLAFYSYVGNSIPFRVTQNSRENALVVSGDNIGVGTSLPNADIHVVDLFPVMRLDNSGVDQAWEWSVWSDRAIGLVDVNSGAYALDVKGANARGFHYITLDSSLANARLHVRGNSSEEEDVQVRVENFNTDSPGTAMKLFQIMNNGPAKFSMFSSVSDEWAFNARNGEFRISKQASGTIEMELSVGGNMEIGGTLTQGSSRAIKQDIEAVSSDSVLEKVIALPIAEWSYKHDGNAVRHVGPMSEDFYQAFGLGSTDKGLTSIDTSGVALAAIQGLKREKDTELAAKDVEIAALKSEKDAEISALRNSLEKQEERMLQMEMVLAELLSEQSGEIRVSAAN